MDLIRVTFPDGHFDAVSVTAGGSGGANLGTLELFLPDGGRTVVPASDVSFSYIPEESDAPPAVEPAPDPGLIVDNPDLGGPGPSEPGSGQPKEDPSA